MKTILPATLRRGQGAQRFQGRDFEDRCFDAFVARCRCCRRARPQPAAGRGLAIDDLSRAADPARHEHVLRRARARSPDVPSVFMAQRTAAASPASRRTAGRLRSPASSRGRRRRCPTAHDRAARRPPRDPARSSPPLDRAGRGTKCGWRHEQQQRQRRPSCVIGNSRVSPARWRRRARLCCVVVYNASAPGYLACRDGSELGTGRRARRQRTTTAAGMGGTTGDDDERQRGHGKRHRTSHPVRRCRRQHADLRSHGRSARPRHGADLRRDHACRHRAESRHGHQDDRR